MSRDVTGRAFKPLGGCVAMSVRRHLKLTALACDKCPVPAVLVTPKQVWTQRFSNTAAEVFCASKNLQLL